MAIVWMDSFYYPSAGIPGAYQFSAAGYYETSSTEGRDGRSCLKIGIPTFIYPTLRYQLAVPLTTLYMGIAIKLSAAPDSAAYRSIFLFNGSGNIQMYLALNNTLTWTLLRGGNNAVLATSSIPFEINKWFYIEIKYTPELSATLDATKLIVNGTSTSVAPGIATRGASGASLITDSVDIKTINPSAAIARFSDFYIDDAMNRGDVIVQGHSFANTGYLNDFASTGDKVAAINSFDTASYLSSSVDAEQYFTPNPAAFPDNIDAYKFHIMVNKSSPGKRYFNHGTYSPQVNYPTLTPYEGAWQIYPMIQTPPSPLTKAQLSAQQFGLRATS